MVAFLQSIALHGLYAAARLPCFSLETPHRCLAAVFDFSTCRKVGRFLIDVCVSEIYAFGALKGVSRPRGS